MATQLSHKDHTRAILVLGLPLIGSHLAQFAVTLTDAVMLGWYDVEVLAQQVLGGMLFFVLFIMGSGFAWAVMPMVAEAESAGRVAESCREAVVAVTAHHRVAALVVEPGAARRDCACGLET